MSSVPGLLDCDPAREYVSGSLSTGAREKLVAGAQKSIFTDSFFSIHILQDNHDIFCADSANCGHYIHQI